MENKPSIGYIYSRLSHDETDNILFDKLKEKVNIVPLPLEKQFDWQDMLSKTKDCKIILNNAAAEPLTFEAIELTKSFEEMGKKVINSSHSFYYQEDKWMFYLKCLENNLPTPLTHLIPKEGHNSSIIKQYLKKGPLVLKAIFSDQGLCVERVTDYEMFCDRLRKIVEKVKTTPIIAQEYIPNNSRCYRVTLIGFKAIQSIVKIGKSWKQTGLKKSEHYRKIKLNRELCELCERAARVFGMEFCGLDLIFSNGKWYFIEANSCPGLDFIKNDEKRVAGEIVNYLCKLCKR